MRTLVPWAVAFGALLLATRTADARCCSVESDCPRGVTCEIVDNTGAVPSGRCNAAHSVCNCDEDCAPGLRCLAGVVDFCTVPVDGGPQTCTKVGQCITVWRGPCRQDADCGVGFQCVLSGNGACTGSSCQIFSTCQQTLESSPCAVDADCISGWTCVNAVAACKPFGPRSSIPGNPSPGYPDELRCYPPAYELFSDNVIVNVSDPLTAYAACVDGAIVASNGGTGGVSAAAGGNNGGVTGEAADSGTAPATPAVESKGGCSLVAVAAEAPHLLAGWSAAMCLALVLRRRRASPSRPRRCP